MQPISREKNIQGKNFKIKAFLLTKCLFHINKLSLLIASIFLKCNDSNFFLSTETVKILLHSSEKINVYPLIGTKIDLTMMLLLLETNFLNHVVLFMKQFIYRFFSFCKWRQGQLLFSTVYSTMSMPKRGGLKENSLYGKHIIHLISIVHYTSVFQYIK